MAKKTTKEEGPAPAGGTEQGAGTLSRRHLIIGWWMVLVWLSLGLALEVMHGLKVDWYLNVKYETRRLMLTLAHSHGALIGALHLGFAYTAKALPRPPSGIASMCLTGASVLLPGGFLLGGLVVYGGDPGKGVLLVPVGAALLIVAVLMTALAAMKR